MNYENFSFFSKTHAGGIDKLWINFQMVCVDLHSCDLPSAYTSIH